MPITPESIGKPDYSSGEWLDTLTYYKVGDQVLCPSMHGGKTLTITRVWPVSPGDMKFAKHAQYVELSDGFGILENSVSAALIQPIETIDHTDETN